MRRLIGWACLAALATAICATVATAPAGAAVHNLTATLTGAEEVPANGSTYLGSATFTIDDVSNQICATWTLDNPGGDPVTAAHIHPGAAGASGGPILDFTTVSGTCVAATPTQVTDILANPASFYFNVHTQSFLGGGARGQLAGATPGSSTTTGAPGSTSTTIIATTSTTTPACHPAYTGVCIPGHLTLDAQVNCSPTPAEFQVMYQVRVVDIGVDPFRLDADNDGIGCESLPLPPSTTPAVAPTFAG